MTLFTSWLWLLVALGPLLFLERWVHRHAQGLGLLITRHPDLALVLYSLVFLPGIIVHEGSHWLMATLLGVRAPKISFWPQKQPDGTLRLGFVETEKVDFFREALIGVAPLLGGCTVILLIGYGRLAVGPLGEALAAGDLGGVFRALSGTLAASDFLIWLYLIFSVSNAMMPSASDRRAWPAFLLILLLLGLVIFWAGFGSLLTQSLTGPMTAGLRVIASAFTITVFIDLIAMGLVWAAEAGLSRVTGLKVEY
ncbi:MAG: hypothetical protein HY023_14125 [Chloroflexi bacterium]|nr:hypothetical protein [Chloroflexota bacterium]